MTISFEPHLDNRLPAIGFAASFAMLEQALVDLAAGENYADRCIAATLRLVHVQRTLQQAINDAERTTGVPWGELMAPYQQMWTAKA